MGRLKALGGRAWLLLALPVSLSAQVAVAAPGAAFADSNAVVLKELLGPDMTEALRAARALGSRRDPKVGEILTALLARSRGTEASRYLFLLRVVLDEVFLLPAPSAAKIAANEPSLSYLFSRLQSISDAATRAALLDISRYLPAGQVEKPLLAEGEFLIRFLERSGGRFTPERRAEATSFLRACAVHDDPVLRYQVARQIELARDAGFVKEARAYLAAAP